MKQKLVFMTGMIGLIAVLLILGLEIVDGGTYGILKKDKSLQNVEVIHGGEVAEELVENNGHIIVVDPGHGGYDPGKVAINNALEKDINLAIALKLQQFLEESGYEVIMTRTVDTCMTDEGGDLGKTGDLDARANIINDSQASLAVSIHQNSYTSEEIKGAQVFYYANSQEGKKAAEVMQVELKKIDEGNHRDIKGDTSYYMLKRTITPTIIVECGFLSNRNEAEKLCDDTYQTEMAYAILKGVETYINL